jgi:hypothetical protein
VSVRTRRLIVALVAVVVVAAMVALDTVTLTRAKPSFDNETQAFNKLLHSQPTTTLPPTTLPVSPTSLPASPTTTAHPTRTTSPASTAPH